MQAAGCRVAQRISEKLLPVANFYGYNAAMSHAVPSHARRVNAVCPQCGCTEFNTLYNGKRLEACQCQDCEFAFNIEGGKPLPSGKLCPEAAAIAWQADRLAFVNEFKRLLGQLTDQQREDVMSDLRQFYCTSCWTEDPSCQCWNDE